MRDGTAFPDGQGDDYNRYPPYRWVKVRRGSAGQHPTDCSIISDIVRPDAPAQKVALLAATSLGPGTAIGTASGCWLERRSMTASVPAPQGLDDLSACW